jgi:hypothetical protein
MSDLCLMCSLLLTRLHSSWVLLVCNPLYLVSLLGCRI